MDEETKKEIALEVTRQVLASIKEEIIPAVQESIKATVNGKVDRLTIVVEGLSLNVAGIHTRLHEQDIRIAPAIETIDTFNSGRKFVIWIAAPVAAIGSLVGLARMIF